MVIRLFEIEETHLKLSWAILFENREKASIAEMKICELAKSENKLWQL